jgi:CRISPR/Cas system CMR subunit Cmr6 (Cas7 group RAMP superfamily)
MVTAAMICVSISAICQSNQTTTIENEWLRNAAKLIEKGKVDAERIKLLNEKISLLEQRIAIKDSMIRVSVLKDTVNSKVIETYKSEVQNLKEQRDIAVSEMKKQNKALRRQKRKTVFVGIGTAGVAVAAYFIFLK